MSSTDTTAEVIKDSYNTDYGSRLTTVVCRFPRVILPQVLTHRMFSRNTSSSRAIPTSKLLDADPWIPSKVGINKPGMQAEEFLEGWDKSDFQDAITDLYNTTVEVIEDLSLKYRIHKQTLNRYLEPWMMTTMIITATEWDNFFALRLHHAAQPEIQELAVKIKQAMDRSTPKEILHGQWHIPFVTEEEINEWPMELLLKLSTARCARVSYLNHEGMMSTTKDFDRHDKLLADKHMSPFEHCANANVCYEGGEGNLRGFYSYRYHVENNMEVS